MTCGFRQYAVKWTWLPNQFQRNVNIFGLGVDRSDIHHQLSKSLIIFIHLSILPRYACCSSRCYPCYTVFGRTLISFLAHSHFVFLHSLVGLWRLQLHTQLQQQQSCWTLPTTVRNFVEKVNYLSSQSCILLFQSDQSKKSWPLKRCWRMKSKCANLAAFLIKTQC